MTRLARLAPLAPVAFALVACAPAEPVVVDDAARSLAAACFREAGIEASTDVTSADATTVITPAQQALFEACVARAA